MPQIRATDCWHWAMSLLEMFILHLTSFRTSNFTLAHCPCKGHGTCTPWIAVKMKYRTQNKFRIRLWCSAWVCMSHICDEKFSSYHVEPGPQITIELWMHKYLHYYTWDLCRSCQVLRSPDFTLMGSWVTIITNALWYFKKDEQCTQCMAQYLFMHSKKKSVNFIIVWPAAQILQ